MPKATPWSPFPCILAKKKKRLELDVCAGGKLDIINDSQLVGTLQSGYYLGVGWQFKKRWQLATTYSRRGVKRGTDISPKIYHIATDALPPYEITYPTFTAINYLNENISFTFAFNVILEVPIYKGLSIESHYKYLISLQPEQTLPGGHYFIALKVNDLQVHYLKVVKQ
jgi:hypothetical protein